VNELLSPTERIWLSWYGHLRVCGYIGTAADLYARLTGRPHPKKEVNLRVGA